MRPGRNRTCNVPARIDERGRAQSGCLEHRPAERRRGEARVLSSRQLRQIAFTANDALCDVAWLNPVPENEFVTGLTNV
jgi:hypothetical protein